jgi:exopolysaccharide biosynthesis polyprenyl glycosylphosphotransferase
VLVGLGLFLLLAFLIKLEFLARTFVLMFAALQLAGLILGRFLLLVSVRWWRRRQTDAHRVVIVGTTAEAVSFALNVKRKAPMSVKILGFIGIPGEEESDAAAKPRLGKLEGLEELLDRLPVDEVVFATRGTQSAAFTSALQACDDRGVDVVLTLPPQFPNQAKMEIANVSGFDLPMIGLRRTPTGELRLALKRLLDIFGGLVGLVLAGPVMIGTAIAIKLDSKGPVFFKQVRAGRNGRRFTMYKFRSMVVDAEEKKKALMHLNEMGGPVFKIKRDPRITKIGALIRKTSVDELPQLFNIVKGDMSLVGPRPPLPSEVEDYEAWQRRRLSVKPGLTGLWQVSGRNQIDFDEWMQMDLEYIDNWSLWLDIKIIFKTVPAVLFHKGAS